jgi:hypothetical protein
MKSSTNNADPKMPDAGRHEPAEKVRYASNDVRLSPRQCLVAALLIAAIFWLIPAAWERLEPLDAGPDYRVPYALGNDYWNYARTCRQLAAGEKILLVGDSVIWGHYVSSEETLSHDLNRLTGREHFVNLGLDGIHPVALCGLIEHYGRAISGERVILNCNLLWMSSPRHDLSADKEFAFNHPGLVPQFSPRIPCYRAPLGQRLGTVVGRNVDFLGWADHVRTAYFGGDNMAAWTLEHPCENPLAPVTLRLPSPDEPPSPRPDARPWSAKGIERHRPEWVDLEHSLQWTFFRRTVELLQDRGNRVFVLVGPYNEHMLTAEGLREYDHRKQQAAAWLRERGILHHVPRALPSEDYADASHPTAEGYRRLAKDLFQQEAFRRFR